MVLLELILSKLCEPISWLALVLGLVTTYVIVFYQRVRKLPPGPTPLPLIGNILQLRKRVPMYQKAIIWSRKFGDPFTVWVGRRPFVIASTKESFKDISGPLRNLVAGRPKNNLTAAQSRGFEDVVFSDFTPAWDVLRRLAHVAMRKYSVTEKLADMVATNVDSEVDEILKDKEEVQYDVIEYVEEIINNVLAESTFGGSFKKGNPDFEKMRQANRDFEKHSPNGLPSDILPILGWIFYKQEKRGRMAIASFIEITDKLFAQAKKSWIKGQNRQFTDVLLNAREEFLAEDRNSAKYLTDENLRQVVFDIFGAGTNTSRSVLCFCFLLLADDQELQDELRNEVLEEIGMDQCLHENRERLRKIESFMQETIRLYPPAPLAVPRKALEDVEINGRSIPRGTAMMINLYAVNRDETIWGPDAAEFKPLRFLETTKDQQARGANSFGIGARSCPGEKLAQSDIFYTLVRTLQKVKLSYVDGRRLASIVNASSDLLLDPCHEKLVFTKFVKT